MEFSEGIIWILDLHLYETTAKVWGVNSWGVARQPSLSPYILRASPYHLQNWGLSHRAISGLRQELQGSLQPGPGIPFTHSHSILLIKQVTDPRQEEEEEVIHTSLGQGIGNLFLNLSQFRSYHSLKVLSIWQVKTGKLLLLLYGSWGVEDRHLMWLLATWVISFRKCLYIDFFYLLNN